KTFFSNQQKNDADAFEKGRILPRLDPLRQTTTKSVYTKHREEFLKEWYGTLELLRNIASRVSSDEFRPTWVEPGTPRGAQADQFLHAYYYEFVKDGIKSIHRKLHQENENRKEAALIAALRWWKSQPEAPHNEDSNLSRAKIILDKIGGQNNRPLPEADFILVAENIHALLDHSLRVRNRTLGLPEGTYTAQAERIVMLAKWIYGQKNDSGKTISDLINYVLRGGAVDRTPERIFDATHDEAWTIPHFGISSVGEMVGWAMPNDFPPRNGRTSKALYALGHQVKIYSE
ncbi:MAG TPA: hypothetical protein VJ508_15090, partial [Saprospiraceae bacterium]|nr:hypothetical protein [Saprospiraceae bacterium]